MSVTWIDIVILLPLVGIVAYEVRQEFGRALLDCLATLLALYFAARLTGPAGEFVSLSPNPTTSAALVFMMLFVALLVAGLFASRFMNRFARLSVDQFDPLFGTLFGLAIAVMVGHAAVSVVWDYYGGVPPAAVAGSHLTHELLDLGALRTLAGSVEQVVQNQ